MTKNNLDFSHLKRFEADAETKVEFEFSQITINGASPVLYVRTSTNANKPFLNAAMKTSSAKKVSKKGRIDLSMAKELRDDERPLYAKHVITGWRNVTNSAGETVDFSTEAVEEFLSQLPDNIFDTLREFCSDTTNFVDTMDIQLGKN